MLSLVVPHRTGEQVCESLCIDRVSRLSGLVEMARQELERPPESKLGGVGVVCVSGRLGEPVTGPRIAMDGDVSAGVAERLLELPDPFVRLELVLLGKVPQDRRLRLRHEVVDVGAVVDDRGDEAIALRRCPKGVRRTEREAQDGNRRSRIEPCSEVVYRPEGDRVRTARIASTCQALRVFSFRWSAPGANCWCTPRPNWSPWSRSAPTLTRSTA